MGARGGAWRQIRPSRRLCNRRGQQSRDARPHPDLDTLATLLGDVNAAPTPTR